MKIPIFPLTTVLFPGGPLPLRIFESRYIDMVSRCMKSDAPFGVLLIRDGEEAGPATTYEVGTLARVGDFYQGSDGLLGITAYGEQRFKVLSNSSQADGLNVGEVELLEPEPSLTLPESYRALPPILANVLDDLGRLYESTDRRYEDAVWLSYRFLEILPVELPLKQASLESGDTVGRLELITKILPQVRSPRDGGR